MLARFSTAAIPPPLLRRIGLFAAGLLVLFLAVQLMPTAPSALPSQEIREAESFRPVPDRGGVRLFSAGNLIAFALLAGGGVFALHLRKQSDGATTASPLRSVGQLHLAQGQQLRLVLCGDDVLLLGVTSGQISLLQRYPADAFDEATVPAFEDAAEPAAIPPGFADLLRSHLGRPTHA